MSSNTQNTPGRKVLSPFCVWEDWETKRTREPFKAVQTVHTGEIWVSVGWAVSPAWGRSGDNSFSWCSGSSWRLRAYHTSRLWAMDPLEKGNGPQSMSLHCGPREQSPFHPASAIWAGVGDRQRQISSLFLNLYLSISASLCFCFLGEISFFLIIHPSFSFFKILKRADIDFLIVNSFI